MPLSHITPWILETGEVFLECHLVTPKPKFYSSACWMSHSKESGLHLTIKSFIVRQNSHLFGLKRLEKDPISSAHYLVAIADDDFFIHIKLDYICQDFSSSRIWNIHILSNTMCTRTGFQVPWSLHNCSGNLFLCEKMCWFPPVQKMIQSPRIFLYSFHWTCQRSLHVIITFKRLNSRKAAATFELLI